MRQGGEPSPGADVGAVSPVPVQISAGEPSPGADVGGVSPVPEKSRLACYRLLRTCFALGRRRSAEAAQRAVGLKDPVPVQMWAGVGSVLVQMWQGWAQSWCRLTGRGRWEDRERRERRLRIATYHIMLQRVVQDSLPDGVAAAQAAFAESMREERAFEHVARPTQHEVQSAEKPSPSTHEVRATVLSN